MIFLKIGRADGCTLKYSNPSVSGLHAEMLILDDDTIFIEDKNSSNGTFVGNHRIEPGVETKVRRGDLIRFGGQELNWAQVPRPERLTNYKRVYSIGSNYRNEIQIDDPYVGRFHASLRIGKDGKAYIRDLGSRNGTVVNGMKITANKDIRVNRGDNITVANRDITDELTPLLPNSNAWIKWTAIGLAAAVVALVAFGISRFLFGGMSVKEARTAVVYVTATYQLNAKIEESPIHDDIWCAVMKDAFPGDPNPKAGEIPYDQRSYSATAFFLDKEGRMATNRHVATPWDIAYLPSADRDGVKSDVDRFVQDQQLPLSVTSSAVFAAYNEAASVAPKKYVLWRMIFEQAKREYENGKEPNFISYANSLLRQLKKSKVSITGKMVEISVGFPGRMYTHTDEYDRCSVIKVAESSDIDLALLQLNSKKTPESVKAVFAPSTFFTGELEPNKDQLVWIGYPRGNDWALDDKTKSLEPQIRDAQATKVPSKYSFEFNGEVQGGASGSPIFTKDGCQLVGVVFGYYTAGTTYGHACQAKYLKKMYEEEVEK